MPRTSLLQRAKPAKAARQLPVDQPLAATPAPEPVTALHPEPLTVGGKLGSLVELMRRPEGADLAALMAATGWQAHSVRGALAGALKKRGFQILSEKESGQPRRYRIPDAADAADDFTQVEG